MSKEWTASEMGRKGGASRSRKKVAAVRRNGQLGGPRLSRRVCKRCHEHRLRPENQSGICRACLRRPGATARKPRKSL